MKKDMAEFINSICSNDITLLEQLITKQYRKFIQFYTVVKEYANLISAIDYSFSSDTSLDLDLTFDTKKKLDTIMTDIKERSISNGYNIEMSSDKKQISMTVFLEEK